MNIPSNPPKTIPTVLILAGGLGTRLAPVIGKVPKILAPIQHTNFFHILVKELERQGVKRIILSLGYLSHLVVNEIERFRAEVNLTLDYYIEPTQLGTLGAISRVLNNEPHDEIIVINGDTFCDISFQDFYLKAKNSYSTIVSQFVQDTSRYGRLSINKSSQITSFIEKQNNRHEEGWINSGIYYFSDKAIKDIKNKSTGDIEKCYFYEKLHLLRAYKNNNSTFIDIGTPDSLKEAETILKEYIL